MLWHLFANKFAFSHNNTRANRVCRSLSVIFHLSFAKGPLGEVWGGSNCRSELNGFLLREANDGVFNAIIKRKRNCNKNV